MKSTATGGGANIADGRAHAGKYCRPGSPGIPTSPTSRGGCEDWRGGRRARPASQFDSIAWTRPESVPSRSPVLSVWVVSEVDDLAGVVEGSGDQAASAEHVARTELAIQKVEMARPPLSSGRMAVSGPTAGASGRDRGFRGRKPGNQDMRSKAPERSAARTVGGEGIRASPRGLRSCSPADTAPRSPGTDEKGNIALRGEQASPEISADRAAPITRMRIDS